MSYTSSDPEYFNRDPDSSSLASTSTTTASDKESKKKKPWSKFKSSIKNIGEKMSSKPSKFTDPTESSEQKRVKKGKRGKAGGEPKPQTTTEEPPRAKSPTKNLMKKLSVESLSTPFVGYQPASVSPTKSYAKALHKSGSTSESNLSASDIDTPKKSLTLDRNIKLAQESPDSGRASQTLGSLEGSRPPSSIKEVASDMSGDSDYTSPRQGLEEKVLGDLVTKTEQFAQSLVSPKGKEQDNDVTVEFLKAETVLKTPTKTDDSPEVSGDKTYESSSKNEAPSGKDNKTEKASSLVDQQKMDEDTLDGRKKKDRVRDSKKEDSLGLIASEQSTATPTKPTYAEAKDNTGETSSKRPEEKSTSEKNTVEDFGNDGKNSNKASKDVKNNDTKTKSEIKPTLTNDEKGINEKPEITPKTELKSETTDERTDNTLSPKQQKSIDLDKKDDKSKTPTKDDKSKTPTKDDEPKTPTKDDKSKTPTKDNEPKTPTKDDKSKTPTKDNEPKTPTKDDKSKTPTKDNEPNTPTKDDKSKTPAKDDGPKTPTKDDKSKTPTKDNEPKTPTNDDKSKTPTKGDELKTPTKDDKSKTPTKDDEPNTPTKDDKSKTPTKDDELKTPTKDDKSKTPTKDDEPKTPTKSDSEKSTLPTPTKIQDVPSSLTDIDPKSQASMSVEEKLQAFLSAEGWSGTFKNVPAKSADGSQPDKRECLYKILVIGELGTGKTSIIKRYVHQFFSQHYRATIGVDFALKVLNWDQNTIIRLQLWDIAGQERFGNMTRVYYKEAVGAFIVFDVTRSATFDAVLKWKQDLDSKVQLSDGSHIPCVLLANKCDQQKEGIVNTPAKMDEYCKENNFSAWFETSAKENINIDEAAKSLVTQILQNDKSSQNGKDSARDGGKFPLDGKSEQESKSCAC